MPIHTDQTSTVAVTDEELLAKRAWAECSLADARRGDRLTVLGIDDDMARVQALRFGVSEGVCVSCVTRIPAGPIVMAYGRQEIAFGRGLARRIRVRREEVSS